MSDDILDLADRVWRGEVDIADAHPVLMMRGDLVELVPKLVAFIPGFANVSAVRTSAGLVLFDSGNFLRADAVRESLRGWSRDRVNTIVFTHGHVDHVFGVPLYEEEARANGWDPPRVIAQEGVPRRFDRYRLTAGYNAAINARQFQAPGISWPVDYRYPDETYRDELRLEVGGELFELHHALGETDDHTWTWMPLRRVVFCGDLITWASPNAGNPQKVQRYPVEWARALRDIAALEAEILLPGHGFPIVDAARVAQVLDKTASLLESLVEQTLVLMNEGASLDKILRAVKPPAELLQRPYLRPIYDEPEFIVRNIWRLYGGWYDGNPANLKPAPDADLAAELARLAGGLEILARRCRELVEAGRLDLAGHLGEVAVLAFPDDAGAHEVRAEVLRRRAGAATSTMAKGVFASAAQESDEAATRLRGSKNVFD